MDARATRRGIPAGVIWGGLGVLVWTAFTILTGGGSAHADEEHGPLGDLTAVVDSTVQTVTAPVVSEVVEPAVDAVVPAQQVVPAVVHVVTSTVADVPIAAPVVDAVADTASSVAAPVVDALKDVPASQIVDPMVDVVSGVPIVGDVVDGLGVTDVVDDVVDVVDRTSGTVGEVAGEMPPLVPGALNPTESDLTRGSAGLGEGPAGAATLGGATDLANLSTAAPGHPSGRSAPVVSELATTAEEPAGGRLPDGNPAAAPPSTPASGSSSAGAGAGPSGVNARVIEPSPLPRPAWTRSSGASDDALPSSPVADTDVSPD